MPLPAAAECLCSCSVCREAKTFERAQPVVNFECVCGFTGGTKSALDRHLARYPGSDFNEQVHSPSVPCSLSASLIVYLTHCLQSLTPLSHNVSQSISLSHTQPHSNLTHILTITCTCYDEIKGIQDLKICSHADSFSLSCFCLTLPLQGDSMDSLRASYGRVHRAVSATVVNQQQQRLVDMDRAHGEGLFKQTSQEEVLSTVLQPN